MNVTRFMQFFLLISLITININAQISGIKTLSNTKKSLNSSVTSFLSCFQKKQNCGKPQKTIIRATLTILGILGVIATGGGIIYLTKRNAKLPQKAIEGAAYGDLKELQQSLPKKPTADYLNQVVNNYGDTLMHVAARNGHHNIIQWLLDNNAIPIINNAGNTPLSEALKYKMLMPTKEENFDKTIDILLYASPGLQTSSK